jgi:hypothetical protein
MTTALTMFAEERSGRKEREREWVGECWQDGRTDSPLSPPSAPIARPGAAPGHRRWPGGRRPRLFGLPADRPNRRRPSEKRGSARPSPPRSPPPTSPLSPVLLRPGPASRICPPPHLPPHFGWVRADAMKGCVAEGPGTEDTRVRQAPDLSRPLNDAGRHGTPAYGQQGYSASEERAGDAGRTAPMLPARVEPTATLRSIGVAGLATL